MVVVVVVSVSVLCLMLYVFVVSGVGGFVDVDDVDYLFNRWTGSRNHASPPAAFCRLAEVLFQETSGWGEL